MKPQKPTPEEILARSDAQMRLVMAVGVSAACIVLGGGSLCIFFVQPEKAKDLWLIVGPILSATMTSASTVIAGKHNAKQPR
ncbi:MAG: hypothetical protein NTV51_09855 [Verrucomicrobia bacterium]|nr:hypothetical protein [Verrucomicrobiota bacterium]